MSVSHGGGVNDVRVLGASQFCAFSIVELVVYVCGAWFQLKASAKINPPKKR